MGNKPCTYVYNSTTQKVWVSCTTETTTGYIGNGESVAFDIQGRSQIRIQVRDEKNRLVKKVSFPCDKNESWIVRLDGVKKQKYGHNLAVENSSGPLHRWEVDFTAHFLELDQTEEAIRASLEDQNHVTHSRTPSRLPSDPSTSFPVQFPTAGTPPPTPSSSENAASLSDEMFSMLSSMSIKEETDMTTKPTTDVEDTEKLSKDQSEHNSLFNKPTKPDPKPKDLEDLNSSFVTATPPPPLVPIKVARQPQIISAASAVNQLHDLEQQCLRATDMGTFFTAANEIEFVINCLTEKDRTALSSSIEGVLSRLRDLFSKRLKNRSSNARITAATPVAIPDFLQLTLVLTLNVPEDRSSWSLMQLLLKSEKITELETLSILATNICSFDVRNAGHDFPMDNLISMLTEALTPDLLPVRLEQFLNSAIEFYSRAISITTGRNRLLQLVEKALELGIFSLDTHVPVSFLLFLDQTCATVAKPKLVSYLMGLFMSGQKMEERHALLAASLLSLISPGLVSEDLRQVLPSKKAEWEELYSPEVNDKLDIFLNNLTSLLACLKSDWF